MTHQFYQVLHRDPTVVFCKSPWQDEFAQTLHAPKSKVAILCGFNWFADAKLRNRAAVWAKVHRRKNPGHRVEFICDTDALRQKFADFQLPATHVHPNALSDERVFRVIDSERLYDSVYTARPAPCKNLQLCQDIGTKWLWLFYQPAAHPNIFKQTLSQPNVVAPQWRNGKYTWFKPHEMAERLNTAHVGLCLSNIEGSNYAATEYGLCGLPVVTAPTRATRDEVLHPECTVSIEHTSITRGIERAKEIQATLGPEMIRKLTLDLLQPHRERFVAAVRRAYQHVGLSHDPAFDLYHLWRHQFLMWQPVVSVYDGGMQENNELLAVASQEPRKNRLWVGLKDRFWERPLPQPVG